MYIKLRRVWESEKTTIGTMMFYNDNDLDNSLLRVFSLEDIQRPEKVRGQTAVPKGRYLIGWTYSPKFRREVLMLHDVPNFERIYIHAGNQAEDTEGCILVGLIRRNDRVDMSREAVMAVYSLISEVLAKGEKVWIEIV